MAAIKALTFDVFGTVVDWRSTIIQEAQTWQEWIDRPIDWAAFADAWRDGYRPAMDRVRRGELPWLHIDTLHRMILDDLLVRFRIQGLSEVRLDHMNRVWHRLIPWPDVIPGLERLKTRYIVATLSNGNMSLLVNMAKHSGLPWDCVLSAELAEHYKPDPEVYITAARLLGLETGEVMMVAAHLSDLRAGRAIGMRTAFVPRPLERGPGGTVDLVPDPSFDVVAEDLIALADRLGV
ncbi:MAG: haloacid dehalogenase type II [Anaerolineae bacterium]|nr:haloacid dehalogenase type II [Anaerolineae bacterium]